MELVPQGPGAGTSGAWSLSELMELADVSGVSWGPFHSGILWALSSHLLGEPTVADLQSALASV